MSNSIWSRLGTIPKFSGFYNSRSFRFALAAVLCIVIFLVVAVGIMPAQYNLEEGMISDVDIYSPRTTTDHAATSRARKLAEDAVSDVYSLDSAVTEKVIEGVTAILRFLNQEDVRNLEPEDREELFTEHFPDLDEPSREVLINLSTDKLNQLLRNVELSIRERMDEGVSEIDRDDSLQHISEVFRDRLDTDSRVVDLLVAALGVHFEENYLVDATATRNARQAARDQVEEIRILNREKIIGNGEKVTLEHISKLQALGLHGNRFNYGYYTGLAVVSLTIFLVWGYFLSRFRPGIFKSTSRTLLLGLIIIITLAAASAIRSADWPPILIPVAMVPMLFTILFDMQTGMFFGVSVSLIVAMMSGGELNVALVLMISSIVASYSVIHVNQRSDLTRAGLLVGLTNLVLTLGLILTGDGINLARESLTEGIQKLVLDLGLAFGGGMLSAIFATGFLPLFENSFGITTSVRLLELANPNQKPLKRLLLEAPGTYHHSILVGNLAEAAAEAVGADPVLARVGSYYHDLGKLSRPYFFIENQFSGDNPHDKIPPSLSSMILTAHVRAGMELAAQYKLPQAIRDIIQQHHGDSLIGYFYHRALSERGGKDHLLEDKFRYEGPRPQSKESAIIMLADSVEAATRALAQPTQTRIANIVRKLIQDRLTDGQLDQCDLTLKELSLIGDAFIRILSGIFHKRIAYPSVQELKQTIAREV